MTTIATEWKRKNSGIHCCSRKLNLSYGKWKHNGSNLNILKIWAKCLLAKWCSEGLAIIVSAYLNSPLQQKNWNQSCFWPDYTRHKPKDLLQLLLITINTDYNYYYRLQFLFCLFLLFLEHKWERTPFKIILPVFHLYLIYIA